MLTFLKNNHISPPFIVGGVLLIIAAAVAYVSLEGVDYLLVIHFDSYRGVDFLGNRTDVFGILAVGLIVCITNLFLAGVFYFRERFLAHLIAYFTAFFALLILIAVLVIISIN